MENFRINTIAAIGRNKELGKSNDLIWKLDADFKHMKETVSGHPLIMGRKTYESIGQEPSYSPCVVITRNIDYVSPYKDSNRTHVVHTFEEALLIAKDLAKTEDIFIFGGAEVYAQAMARTDRLHLTEINAEDVDVFFPEYPEHTVVTAKTDHVEGDISFSIKTLEKIIRKKASVTDNKYPLFLT